MSLIPQSFYSRDTRRVAKDLLGKVLCVRMPAARGKRARVLRAMIVETEAYLGVGDRAAHSYGGRRTRRVESMYLAGGHAYVFFIYGMYYCLNVVTREPGNPQAVLIRAVQPLDADLQTNGPGKLCRAYRIDRGDDGVKLFSRRSRIWIEEGEKKKHPHIATTRVGIDYAGDAKHWPLRFYIEGNPYVSRKV